MIGILLVGSVAAQTVHYEFEGNVDDSVGVQDGTAFGSPVYVDGPVGQAIALDGANDYVQLPANIANYTDITVAAWVRWDGGGGAWQRIFDFGVDQNTYMFLTPYSGGGTLRFAITTSSGGGEEIIETSPLSVGKWTHVAVTLSGNTGTLYVDGVSADSGTIILNPADITQTANYIGESQWPDPLFNGKIDDFRIYNTALTGGQIAALVDLGNPPVDPPPATISVDTTTDPLTTLDLSGTWDFDPDNGSATTIQVPGGGWLKQGFTCTEADYSTSITIPNIGQPQVTRLEFGAVNYQADLYVDTVFVASKVQSYTSAAFDITDYVTPGSTHDIRVHVKGRNAFMSGGRSVVPNAAGWSADLPEGIFRSAELKIYPKVYISDVFVKPSVSNSNLSYEVWIRNASTTTANVTLSGTLSSWNGDSWSYPALPSQAISLAAGTETNFTVGPVSWNLGTGSYWWPNVPYQPGYTAQLHNLNLSLAPTGGGAALHTDTTRFGFRECTQGPDGLGNTCYFLNGIRVNFRGDNLQGADYDNIFYNGGRSDAYDTLPGFLPPAGGNPGWPQAVDNYQRLNYNVNRIHQQPCTPYMLSVCDEKGLMIIEETAIRGSADDQNFITGHDNMVNHLKALYARDRNHASIVRQSLSNEPDQSGTDSVAFANDLYNAAMEVDGTRPLSIDPGGSGQSYDSMTYANFSAFRHYVGPANPAVGWHFSAYTDEVLERPDRPYGQGEYIWSADNTAQGLTWFGTSCQAMRAKGASDIRPYTLLSGWSSIIPGVDRTDMVIEQGGHPLFGEDNLPNPWSNPIIQRVQAGFNPVLVADAAYWDAAKYSNANGDWPPVAPSLPASTLVTRTLNIYNDTFSDEDVDVFWELRQGSATGTLLKSGVVNATVPLGYVGVEDITFTTPNTPGEPVFYVLYSEKGGVEMFRETAGQQFELASPVVNIPLVNPGFELPGTGKIVGFDNGVPGWSDVGSSADSGVEAVNAHTGSYAAFLEDVASGNDGVYQVTDYLIQAGDVFKVGFWAKDIASSTGLTVTLFGDTVGVPANVLGSYTSGMTAGYVYYETTIAAPAGSAGKLLGIQFENETSGNSWSALDDVTLTVTNSSSPIASASAPAAPTAVAATAGDGSISLDWADNTETNLASYTVYRSLTSDSHFAPIASGLGSSDFVDTTVNNGIAYYYLVTATDANSLESVFSSPAVSAVSSGILPEEFHIAHIAVEGGSNLSLTVSNSVSGHDYWLYATDTLTPPVWSNLVVVPGTGSNLQFGIPIDPASTNRFFKLDVQQQ